MPDSRPVVHLFFNGNGCFFPPGAAWEKFQGLDSARTFLICAESWWRAGWQVRRLSTVTTDGAYVPTPFLPAGECSRSWHWYPAPFWQFVAKAKAIAARAPRAWHWFATIDVINFGFKNPLEGGAPDLPACMSYQREHFSMALLCCNWAWLCGAEQILIDYDRGKLPSLNREYTSDETILRNYAPSEINGRMTFASNTEKDAFPLLHFSRSAVPPAYHAILTS